MATDLPPDEYTDIVVVGSGVAGLSAAVEARLKRANVQLFESQGTIGGASMISAGGCCIVDTPLQRRAGIRDTVDGALSEWYALGGPTVDRAWARQYVENSKTFVYDWVEQLGIRWTDLKQPEGNKLPRWHQPEGWGRAVVHALLKRAHGLGVDIRTSSRVRRLLVDNNAVTGVEVEANGKVYKVTSPVVIVCTGGFASNIKQVLEWSPALRMPRRLLGGGGIGAQGDGHAMLQQDADADLCCLDHIWLYPVGTPDPLDSSGTRGIAPRLLRGDIWLNVRGERFHNDALTGPRIGSVALLNQPGQTAWMVFSASEIRYIQLYNNLAYFPPASDGEDLPAKRSFWDDSTYAWRASTVEELAENIGLPKDAVRSAIDTFNADIRAGLSHDSHFGRPLRDATPLERNLAAIQIFPMAQKTFGGVRTDLKCRVVRRSGGCVRGLFAAGEVAGMAGGCINGRAALEGTMFGPSLYSGRVAGMAAASHVTRSPT
ncbi:fumarate reductase/succinate dehydrogenase flavoprotein domain-containing protein [Cladophialophora carrionii]|uniref:Fumarate reductase/succinate dehydrogenase flavoprotein domain-containing protein n=1 Tax=Cladophialophora carrionii TaxID=86049 RepID=A0A1C1C863_9EURO|nr:fumarate reductase/succinate dehydrogenase flavoprotein domain-containing protein [Cladophialophora carrionii]